MTNPELIVAIAIEASRTRGTSVKVQNHPSIKEVLNRKANVIDLEGVWFADLTLGQGWRVMLSDDPRVQVF